MPSPARSKRMAAALRWGSSPASCNICSQGFRRNIIHYKRYKAENQQKYALKQPTVAPSSACLWPKNDISPAGWNGQETSMRLWPGLRHDSEKVVSHYFRLMVKAVLTWRFQISGSWWETLLHWSIYLRIYLSLSLPLSPSLSRSLSLSLSLSTFRSIWSI